MRHEIYLVTHSFLIRYQLDICRRIIFFKDTAIIYNGIAVILMSNLTDSSRNPHGEGSRHVQVGFLYDLSLAFGHAQRCPQRNVLFGVEKNIR